MEAVYHAIIASPNHVQSYCNTFHIRAYRALQKMLDPCPIRFAWLDVKGILTTHYTQGGYMICKLHAHLHPTM